MSENKYWVGHFYDKNDPSEKTGSDKIYVATLIENVVGPNREFVVTGHWGKRTRKQLSCQEKYKGHSSTMANSKFRAIVQKQETKKGYMNVESNTYAITSRIPSNIKVKPIDLIDLIGPAMDEVQEAEEKIKEEKGTSSITLIQKIANSLEMDAVDVDKETYFVVKCISWNGSENELTVGSTYMAKLSSLNDETFIRVIDNQCNEEDYFTKRFEVVKE